MIDRSPVRVLCWPGGPVRRVMFGWNTAFVIVECPLHPHTHTHTHSHTHTHTHILYKHAHTHTHTHTYCINMQTHTHTQAQDHFPPEHRQNHCTLYNRVRPFPVSGNTLCEYVLPMCMYMRSEE